MPRTASTPADSAAPRRRSRRTAQVLLGLLGGVAVVAATATPATALGIQDDVPLAPAVSMAADTARSTSHPVSHGGNGTTDGHLEWPPEDLDLGLVLLGTVLP